ncbi:EPIDERMAL PATTERNING FACTOR-like protein 1 [Phragmites australis]|uniref:EPIDERMAL PATTERNING FACTOR-like protein 1 n=1 Tax=Phragmites australis TaxID=29695 RepID=UPI002D777474|nr:EPIDERMAL PATTERNING FACTOR-like protein 1 [Phragmites australis]
MAVSSPRRALLVAMFLSFLLGAATSIRTTTFSSSQKLVEDKSRLGSTPPSCRNRCSACHPCTPVQVTTIPGSSRSAHVAEDAVAGISRYSNYKPLGWKCGCAGRLYDP